MKMKALVCTIFLFNAAAQFLKAAPDTVYVPPYIELSNSVSPDTIWKKGLGRLPDTTSPTLRIDAFGGSLTFEVPLDVVLLTDNSGSMLRRATGNTSYPRYPGDRDSIPPLSRIQATYNACMDFIDNSLRPETDRVAHMLFCARIDTPVAFTDDFGYLKAKMDTTLDGSELIDGVRYTGTAFWSAVHEAIHYAMANRRPGQIPVIIAMTDGQDNASYRDGSYDQNATFTLGRTQRNAVDSLLKVIKGYQDSVRVFTISLVYQDAVGIPLMQELADSAHGEFAYSATGDDLSGIYAGIGELIRKLAAQSISSRLAMIVEGLPSYIQYVPNSWQATSENTVQIDSVVPYVVGTTTELRFYTENINVDDTFEVTYQIQSTKSGYVNINYGTDIGLPTFKYSTVRYRDYTGVTPHIDTFATQYIMVADTLVVDSLTLSATGIDTDKIEVRFNISKAQAMLLDTVYLYYSDAGWVTSTASPSLAIPYATLVNNNRVVISGLEKFTMYYFTTSARNILGERTRIDTLFGAKAMTKAGGPVMIGGWTGDRNGDGYIDVFTIKLDEALIGDTLLVGPAGFTISYTAGGVNQITVDSVRVNGADSTLILYGTNNGTISASPFVRRYQDSGDQPTITYNGSVPFLRDLEDYPVLSHSVTLDDHSGPVISRAEYDEGTTIGQPSDDILYIYFSENISDSTWLVAPSVAAVVSLLGTGALGTDAVISTGAVDNDNIIEIHFGATATAARVMQDSLVLRPNILHDVVLNPVNANNRPIVITSWGGGALMVGGWTGDADGDGYLDRLTINFSKNLQNSGIVAGSGGFTVQNTTNQLTVDSVQIIGTQGRVVLFCRNSGTQNKTFLVRAGQDTDDEPRVSYDSTTGVIADEDGHASRTHQTTLADRAGPVVSQAEYQDNNTPGVTSDDILVVYLSEDVQDASWQASPPSAVFRLVGAGSFGTTASLVTGTAANDRIVEVRMGPDSQEPVAFQDSVGLVAGRIRDANDIAADALNQAIVISSAESLFIKIENFPTQVTAGQPIDGFTIKLVNPLDSVVALSDSIILRWDITTDSGTIISPYGGGVQLPDSSQYLQLGILNAADMTGNDLQLLSAVEHTIRIGIRLPDGSVVWSDPIIVRCVPGNGYKVEVRTSPVNTNVFPDTFFVAPDVVFRLYAGLHDMYGNYIREVVGQWRTLGLVPALADTDSVVQHTFTAIGTGSLRVTATPFVGDSLAVVVRYFNIEDLDSLVIVDRNNVAIGNLNLTTDNDATRLYTVGFDSLKHLMGYIRSDWTVIGNPVGTLFPAAGESTILTITKPGTCWVVAHEPITDHWDTTGMLYIRAGQVTQFIITPDSSTLTADSTIRYIIIALDADGNITTDIGTITGTTIGNITGTFTYSGDTVFFNPISVGIGQIVVTSSYGISDTTAYVRVTPGAFHHLGISPAGPETLYLEEERVFYSIGYDFDNNTIGAFNANWDTVGTLIGFWGKFNSIDSLLFVPSAPGEGWIVANRQGSLDTVAVVVMPYRVDSVAVWLTDHELGDTAMTTDDDSTVLFARGYDSTGLYLGLVRASWALLGDQVGTFSSSYSSSVVFDLTTPGTSWVAIYYQNRAYDTSGVITVAAGTLYTVQIRVDHMSFQVGDTARFTVVTRDADGNLVPSGPITWWSTNQTGTLNTTDPSNVYLIGERLGDDIITVTTANGRTDTITITVFAQVDSFRVTVNDLGPNIETSIFCTLTVVDDSGRVIPEFSENKNPIKIEIFARAGGPELVPSRNVSVTHDSLDQISGNWYLRSWTPFNQGQLVIKVLYNVAGESLFIRFTDEVDNVSGTSPAVLWEDPEMISELCLYPSPVNLAQHPLKFEYVLKYDSDVTIRVFSDMGSFVWEGQYKKGAPGGRKWNNLLQWDGKTRKGKQAASGAYIVKILVENSHGSQVKTKKVGVLGKK